MFVSNLALILLHNKQNKIHLKTSHKNQIILFVYKHQVQHLAVLMLVEACVRHLYHAHEFLFL